MATTIKFNEGQFCWADLATTDAQNAKVFYSELFNWKILELPTTDEEMPYIMFMRGESAVCAMYEMDSSMKEQGIPTNWKSYIAVDDVDRMCQKASELGATIIMEPFDVMQAGRMAIIEDPQKAVVALWQNREQSTTVTKENNTIVWNELYVHDTQKAREFYKEFLNWNASIMPTDNTTDYTIFQLAQEAVGGMLEIQEEWGEIPPHWAIYFQVKDLKEKMDHVQNLGGSLVSELMSAKDVGDFVVVQDPQGGHFLMIEPYK